MVFFKALSQILNIRGIFPNHEGEVSQSRAAVNKLITQMALNLLNEVIGFATLRFAREYRNLQLVTIAPIRRG